MTRVVIYEDRPSHWVGVQLTLLSLQRHDPDLAVLAHLPGASQGQIDWLAANVPMVEVRRRKSGTLGGWNVKPSVLLAELSAGADEVVWIDTDIVVTRPLRATLRRHPSELLVCADNAAALLQGTAERTRAWGLPVGRLLPRSVNSGFIRAFPHHAPLLEDWQTMLSTVAYQQAQSAPWAERPLHFWGDQEALTALLCSTRASDVEVHLLRAGIDIAQSQGPRGWTVVERLVSAVLGGPLMVHSMGPKPWLVPPRSSRSPEERGLGWRLADVQVRLSAYTRVAWQYREALEEGGAWLDDHPAACRGGSARLCGLPGIGLAVGAYPVAIAEKNRGRKVAKALRRWVENHHPRSPF